MPATQTLTPRQRDVCEVVARLTQEFGHPPALAEVGAVLGIHPVTAFRLARGAVARGAMTAVPGSPRTWVVVDPQAIARS